MINSKINLVNNSSAKTTTSQSISHNTLMTKSVVMLDEGQTIKGEVVDIRNDEVSVRLNENDTITAKLEGASELVIGQKAIFKVVDASPQNLTIQQLKSNLKLSEEITILNALDAAGLPKNDKNKSIVKELLANQMSIDKQTILKILHQSFLNKDASINTIVLMNKHKFPITEKTLAQFEHYRNNENVLTNDIENLSKDITQIIVKKSLTSNYNNLIQINNTFTNTFLNLSENNKIEQNLTINNISLPFSDEFLTADDRIELVDLLENFSMSDELKLDILNNNASIKDIVNLIKESLALLQDNEISFQPQESENEQIDYNTILNNNVINKVLSTFSDIGQNNDYISSFLNEKELDTLFNYVQKLDFNTNNNVILNDISKSQLLQDIKHGNISSSNFIKLISENMASSDEKSIRNLFISKEYQNIFSHMIKKNMLLDYDDLKKENGVNKYYNKIYNTLNDINNFVNQINTNNDETLKHSSLLKDNIDFMKTINDMFTYIQLPVNLKGKKLHSDLYVYSNKKNLQMQRENISILLHLNMDYLGDIDIYATLSKNNLSTKFYLEDSQGISIINDNINNLIKSINKLGFNFSYEVNRREKKVDIVNDLIEKDVPKTQIKRFSFDIRA